MHEALQEKQCLEEWAKEGRDGEGRGGAGTDQWEGCSGAFSSAAIFKVIKA